MKIHTNKLKIILASLYFKDNSFAIRGYRIGMTEEESLAQHIVKNHSIKFNNIEDDIKELIRLGIFEEVENKEYILKKSWGQNNYYVNVEYTTKRRLRLYKNTLYSKEHSNLYELYLSKGENRNLALKIIEGIFLEKVFSRLF